MKLTSSTSHRNRLPFTAITLTLLASTGAAALVAQLISSRPEPTPLMSSSSERIDEIVIRLERIENRLAEINTQPAPASGPQVEPETEEIAGGQDTFGLGQRLARLEQIEQDRQDAAQRRAEERRLQLAQMAAAATDVMLDPLADDQMKAGAWGQIRMNAAETWSDLIVAEAVRIGTSSTNPQMRADIWRQAHAGRTHPLLLQPLLYAMANDLERTAREEAAETLDLYLDQPGVREALQIAAQYDADPGVRRQALTSLNGPQGGF